MKLICKVCLSNILSVPLWSLTVADRDFFNSGPQFLEIIGEVDPPQVQCWGNAVSMLVFQKTTYSKPNLVTLVDVNDSK